MSDFSIRVIFLHHNTDSLTLQNYQSFIDSGNKITAIHDSDSPGLDGSVSVPISGTPIPRGRKRWDSDTPHLNYVLSNYDNIQESHILICEWDCFCRCNLEELMSKYKDNDITVPRMISGLDGKNPHHFNSVTAGSNPSLKKLKLAPSTFILFKKEALLIVANKCASIWKDISPANSEVRLGVVALECGLNVVLYDKEICSHIHFDPIPFLNPNLIYHPVKEQFGESYFYPTAKQLPKYIGKWEFGRKNGDRPFATVTLNENGRISDHNCTNETFWQETETGIEFLNWKREVNTKFTLVDGEKLIGDWWNGKEWVSEWHWLKKIK